MTTELEQACLKRIFLNLHPLIIASALRWQHRAEVLAGIAMRESWGGELLDSNGLGDGGHGHGICQIDDRSYPDFCMNGNWRDSETNIMKAGEVLDEKRRAISKGGVQFGYLLSTDLLERAAIAAYNCGQGTVIQSIRSGEDIDTHTASGNYSRRVLEYATFYREIMREMREPQPARVPEIPEPQAAVGFWVGIFSQLMRIFRRRQP